eukprot:1680053-Pyramimonas_sp.AAC.1
MGYRDPLWVFERGEGSGPPGGLLGPSGGLLGRHGMQGGTEPVWLLDGEERSGLLGGLLGPLGGFLGRLRSAREDVVKIRCLLSRLVRRSCRGPLWPLEREEGSAPPVFLGPLGASRWLLPASGSAREDVVRI